MEWIFFIRGAPGTSQETVIVSARNQYYGGTVSIEWAPRFEDRSELNLEDGSLVIHNVAPYETGTYRCILRTPNQHDRSWDTRVLGIYLSLSF